MSQSALKLSVVIIFHNMRREAARTLYSLTTAYQLGLSADEYEVIAIDSNSTEPLDGQWVESLQQNFIYHSVQCPWPSPCQAMNIGIDMARAEHVVCMVDGARILSPGVLAKMIQANRLFDNAFVQTIAMHLGDKLQNDSMLEGYNQAVEDQLLSTVDWQQDGYQLFNICCLAGSSINGFFKPIAECNCFSLKKATLMYMGGFDEDFKTLGGGLVNHDLINKTMADSEIQPVMLLGEASFHQFHGGVATNVPRSEHPMQVFLLEYQQIRGKAYEPVEREAFFIGDVHEYARKFIINDMIET